MATWPLLSGLGAVGLLSLLAVPLERLLKWRLPTFAVRLAALVQPALLTVLALWVGASFGPRVGFGAPLLAALVQGGNVLAVITHQAPYACGVAAVAAVILATYAWRVSPRLASVSPAAARLADFKIPLATRVLYGGIVEELLTRWGLMTLVAFAATKAIGRGPPPPSNVAWAAIIVSAVLFAVGHLPLLFAASGKPPLWIAGSVLAGNTVPGVLFGWLFWREGIEAAMMAHGAAHLLAAPFIGRIEASRPQAC